MLFLKRYWQPIRDSEVTMAFRRWKSPRVLAGRRYRTAAAIIEVDSINEIIEADVTDEDARRAGHANSIALLSDLPVRSGLPLYRIVFHVVDEPDPRAELAADAALTPDDVAAIARRLERLDLASSHGAWTRPVLEAIAAHPRRRAPDLAALFGRETQPFKTDVRKLKNLGLTISLRIGYELSPRGQAYLRAIS
jgi:hypothetical protein